jgi:hypothetical protein
MDVFISWSGDRSKRLALLLHQWLQQVVNQLRPWMSSEDISKGKQWSPALAEKLDATNQGIVCVTRANLGSPWLNYESGALAKAIGRSAVRPLLLDVTAAQLRTRPLGQFQATVATDREDMVKFMRSLNDACGNHAIPGELLMMTFDNAWAQFSAGVQQILRQREGARDEPDVDVDAALRELLQRVRQIQATLGAGSTDGLDADSLPHINVNE